jgi:hypothetical protein
MERQSEKREPAGFTTHTSGRASEHAREQGWQTNEEERTKMPPGKQNEDGGTDHDYGARDFGDEPVDTSQDTSQDTSEGTSQRTTQEIRSQPSSEVSSETGAAQPAPVTPKKEKNPTAKPRSRSKKAA